MVLIVAGLWFWSHHTSPDTKAEREHAAVTGTAKPTTFDATLARLNLLRGKFDEGRAHDAATDSLTGETFETVVGSAQCSDDCSGHEAGWQSAQVGNPCDENDYGSFYEGCTAYQSTVAERVANARKAYEAGDNTFEKIWGK